MNCYPAASCKPEQFVMFVAAQKPDLLVRVSSFALKTIVFASGKWKRRSCFSGHSFIVPWWKALSLCKVPENLLRPELPQANPWGFGTKPSFSWVAEKKYSKSRLFHYPNLQAVFFLILTERYYCLDQGIDSGRKRSSMCFSQWSKCSLFFFFWMCFMAPSSEKNGSK